jgi:hypothetical protein
MSKTFQAKCNNCKIDARDKKMLDPMFHVPTEYWLKGRGLWPDENTHPDWGFKVEISTVPPWDWTVRRSHVGENEYWLGASISRILGWRVGFFPRNELFKVDWQAEGMSVTSQQLRFRKLMKWPQMGTLDEFPKIVAELQSLLSLKFHQEITVRALSLKVDDLESIRIWLQDICQSIKLEVVELTGTVPKHLVVPPPRIAKAAKGYTLRFPSAVSIFEGSVPRPS